jgi:hypothetical protein
MKNDMKKIITALFLLFASIGYGQEYEVNAADLPLKSRNSKIPKNIYMSEVDVTTLGAQFTQQKNLVIVTFKVTEETLELSATNDFLIRFDEEKSKIEYGCLVPAVPGSKSLFRLNDVFDIKVDRVNLPTETMTTKGT